MNLRFTGPPLRGGTGKCAHWNAPYLCPVVNKISLKIIYTSQFIVVYMKLMPERGQTQESGEGTTWVLLVTGPAKGHIFCQSLHAPRSGGWPNLKFTAAPNKVVGGEWEV
ncbi:11967_t:CDS:1, partial [Acaulospora colombiana]